MTNETEFGSWFDEDELERCPSCGERKLIPREHGGFRVCLDCGVVETGNAANDVAAHARAEDEHHRDGG